MTAVAVLGLGAMGSRLARRLLDADHEVVVWNRSPEKTTSLTQRGAIAAASPAEAARRVEILLTMVADASALQRVATGPEGLIAGARDGLTVVEMSTVGPAAILELASVLPSGTGMLDAPVLGSTSEAEAGSLRLFVGGETSLVERWTPLLSVLGSPLHVGPLGAGAAAKLVANSTLFAVLVALGEAIALADALGLSRDRAFEVLATTPLAAQAERRRETIETAEYPRRFSLALAHKDADLVVEAAAAAGSDLRLASAARAWLADAHAAGLGDADYSAVLAHILATSPR